MKPLRALLLGILGIFAFQGAFAAPLKAGLVLDRGGRDDKSFNAAAFAGATLAEKELGVSVKTVEASDDNAFESLHRSFAGKNFDLIIGVGVSQMDALKKVAAKFPEKKFAIVDAQVDLPNVQSLLFAEHEGSFLMGAIAALKSKDGKLGFIGGMDIPLIRRFQMGYEAGAKHVNPKASVVSNYVGVTSDAWNNPAKAKELALSQYRSGIDIIFSAAGASGAGLFDAAEETKRFAIGVDSNQNWIRPGRILTSMLKRVDLAVLESMKELKAGTWKGGVKRFGLSNQGVDYALDEHNRQVFTPEIKKRVDEIKANIVAGKVKVPDYYSSRGK